MSDPANCTDEEFVAHAHVNSPDYHGTYTQRTPDPDSFRGKHGKIAVNCFAGRTHDNVAANCIDRHPKDRADWTAIIRGRNEASDEAQHRGTSELPSQTTGATKEENG